MMIACDGCRLRVTVLLNHQGGRGRVRLCRDCYARTLAAERARVSLREIRDRNVPHEVFR